MYLQNEVTMEAVQVTSDEGIDSITPMKRGCLFSYEQPENYTLKGHKKYTQVSLWKGFNFVKNIQYWYSLFH